MGFLNGLVNDMLKESVGYDVGKITRMVGGKNLLMLGAGAALAGGLSGGFGNQPQSGPSTWAEPPRAGGAGPSPPPPAPPGAQPPPLPPVPGAAAAPPSPPTDLPPLPPTPGPTSAADSPPPEIAPEEVPISEELTYGIVRSMVAAALADGNLDPSEKKVILDRLGSSGLDADRIRQVHQDLVIPPDPSELAAMTDAVEEREAMYRFAGLILLTDGSVSELERSWLDRLATAFGFDGDHKAALEAEIFES